MSPTWDAIRSSVRQSPVDAVGDLGQALDDWEHAAHERATYGLLQFLGEEAKKRYQYDQTFHMAIDMTVNLVVAALFDRDPLTDDERDARLQSLNMVVGELGGMSREVPG